MSTIISIIVPIYNVENYISRCIESILNQSLVEIELILVDDGSSDNSGYICDKYAKNDSRIKAIHKENGGVSSARNLGVKVSTGKYIGFVDPDDYVDIDMYKKLYELCIKSNSDIAICKLGREINGNIINKSDDEVLLELNNLEGMRELFKGELYRFSLCNKLFNKKCFDNIKFPEGRIHEDLSTTYRLFANSNKSIYTNYMGYIYVKRENSILTSKYSEKRLQSFVGWDEIIDFMSNKYSEVSGYDEKKDAFINMLKNLPEGISEVHIHPSIDSEEIRKINPTWKERVLEYSFMMDDEIEHEINKNNIKLITYKDISKFNNNNNSKMQSLKSIYKYGLNYIIKKFQIKSL